jgi:PAS domain S-box-containing protein
MTATSPGTAGANPGLLAFLAQRTPNAVIVTDPTGRIEWVNDGFSRLTGYTPEEVQGFVPGAILQGPKTDADTIARMAEALARAEGFDVELVNYAKNGEPYWVHIDCQPIVENGELTHFVAIESDVTARKTLEENLLRAERVARLGHWTLDVASETVSWSDEAYHIFGMPVGAPLGGLDAILERYHPTDAADVRALSASARAIGRRPGSAARSRTSPSWWMPRRAAATRKTASAPWPTRSPAWPTNGSTGRTAPRASPTSARTRRMYSGIRSRRCWRTAI